MEVLAILGELARMFLGLEICFSKFKCEPNIIWRKKASSRNVSEKFHIGPHQGRAVEKTRSALCEDVCSVTDHGQGLGKPW